MIARWLRRRRTRAAAEASRQAAAEHDRWVARVRLAAMVQKHAVPSHPENGFCFCGIPQADWDRFTDEMADLVQSVWPGWREEQ